jgi:hypothetical protein
LGQIPRLGKMASICLGVGCERKSKVLVIGPTRKPRLLFRRRGGVRTEEGKSIESIVKCEIIQFSCLCLADDLPRLVKAVQGKGVVGEIRKPTYVIRSKPHGLPRDLRGLLILPL